MPAHDPSSYDVFLILPEATLRFAVHRAHVRALNLHADGEALIAVDMHYRAATDTAMLGLRLVPGRVRPELVERILDVARAAELPVFQPERLPPRDQQRFYEGYLTTYEQRLRDLPTPDAAMRLLARWLQIPTSPPDAPVDPSEAEPTPLDVRFRRGDTWHLGRLCSLTQGGLYVASGVPPRPGDAIELEVSAVDKCVPLRAVVVQVTPLEAATKLGVAGFGARFLEADPATHAELCELLSRSGVGEKLVAQPPRRRHVRYPVRVPVAVEFLGTQLVTVALDLSAGGAFVKTPVAPLRADVAMSLALPGEGAPIRAHARITRTVSEEAAFERRVSPGFGVMMDPISALDCQRLRAWLDGVARRTGCAVLVAGSPARVGELCAELSAVGYAASGVGELGALRERLRAQVAPDAVVLDSMSAATEEVDDAARTVSAHGVPVIVAGPEPPGAVISRVDEEVARA